MTITAAIVLYAVLWFLGLFIALPIGERSQSEEGEIVPGTPASAPVNPNLRKKVFWVTIVTTVVWAILFLVIASGVLTVEMFDIFNRMDQGPGDG